MRIWITPVTFLSGLSAHADQAEILHWLKGFKKGPQKVFIVHGEPQASDALRLKIQDSLGWPAIVPASLESIGL
jgi:metallo-beta-lactamase family protein